MLFSAAKGRKVVSTSTAETVGRIEDFVVDPAAHSVIALVLKKTPSGDILRWSALTAFGEDAVTVTGADTITAADEQVAALSGKHHKILGKRVLTVMGDAIGEVGDVEFNPESGEITALHVGTQQVPGVLLRGIGSYAAVVDLPPR